MPSIIDIHQMYQKLLLSLDSYLTLSEYDDIIQKTNPTEM